MLLSSRCNLGIESTVRHRVHALVDNLNMMESSYGLVLRFVMSSLKLHIHRGVILRATQTKTRALR